jgi:hypothetical protein
MQQTDLLSRKRLSCAAAAIPARQLNFDFYTVEHNLKVVHHNIKVVFFAGLAGL